MVEIASVDFVEFGFGKPPSSFSSSSAVLSREGRLYLRKLEDASVPWPSAAYVADILRCSQFSSMGQEIQLGETGRENLVVKFASREAAREWFAAIKRTLVNGARLRSGAPGAAPAASRAAEAPARSVSPALPADGGVVTRTYSQSVSLTASEARDRAALLAMAGGAIPGAGTGGGGGSGIVSRPSNGSVEGASLPSLSSSSSSSSSNLSMMITRGSSIELRRSHRKPIEDQASPQLLYSSSSRTVGGSVVLRGSLSSPTVSSGSDFESLGSAELGDLIADLHEQVRAAKKLMKRRLGTLNSLSRERQTSMIQLSKDMFQSRDTVSLGDRVVHVLDVDQDAIEYVDRIGIGQNGTTVYRAVVKGFSLAVKVFTIDDSSLDDVDILRHEISLLEKLQHENIVSLLGYHLDESAREVRIFTEMHSGTLRDVLDRRFLEKRFFSPVDVMRIATEIGRGLNYLHSQKPVVIHRDLKTDNIFVQWDATYMPVKLHKNVEIGRAHV